MRVLVTGATGFVGLNVVSELLARGCEVRAYMRSGAKTQYLDEFQVEPWLGELTDVAQLTAAMVGLDAVIHIAGNTSCREADRDLVRQTNTVGTQAVVQAALGARIRRVVFTSTTSTIGAASHPARHWDETESLTGYRARSPYGASKSEAERVLLAAVERGLEPIILNPAEIIGAFDHNMHWGRLIVAAAAGQLPFIPPGGGSFCSARAVAKAHVDALTMGTPGHRYILAGVDMSYGQLIEEIKTVVRTQPEVATKEYNRAYYQSIRSEHLRRTVKSDVTDIDSYRLRVFKASYFFDSSKAVRFLGYDPGDMRQAIRDAYEWYVANGFIRHSSFVENERRLPEASGELR